jgi:LPS export ABC transporter permease LptG
MSRSDDRGGFRAGADRGAPQSGFASDRGIRFMEAAGRGGSPLRAPPLFVKTLDRYIVSEWLKILGLVLTATLGLLLMQEMYDDFRDLLDAGAGLIDIGVYYAVRMPSFLTVVLPLAVLISLLYSLGQLHRNNEFTAMRAAGLSIFRLTRGIWLIGALCCGLMWLCNSRVVPWSVEESRRIKDSLIFRHQATKEGVERAGLVSSIAFDNRAEGRLWYINRFNRFAGRAYGVTVSVLDPQRHETLRYLAREAEYDPAKRAWTFFNGSEIKFDPDTGEVVRPTAFALRTIPDFHEDPTLMLLIDRNPVDLSFRELRRLIDYLDAEGNPKVTKYAMRYYSLIADTLGCLIVIGIAIPFSVAGVRVSPAVGVSKSIGLFFIYYLLTTLANTIGGRELLTPQVAVWVPDLVMIGLSTWFFGRLR